MHGHGGRWILDAPTRLRLWVVERQLRRTVTSALSPDHRAARLHSLNLLRAYRRLRQFPRNDASPLPTPVFVDAGRRHCAVAHLMRRAGHGDQVDHIAAGANLGARAPDLRSLKDRGC